MDSPILLHACNALLAQLEDALGFEKDGLAVVDRLNRITRLMITQEWAILIRCGWCTRFTAAVDGIWNQERMLCEECHGREGGR